MIPRLLLLTQTVPYPLDSGAKVRQYYVLRHLAERHEVTLVCFRRGSDGEQALAHLRGLCREVVTVPLRRDRRHEGRALAASLATGVPFTVTRDHYREMSRTVTRLAADRQFDVVHADQLAMAQYGLEAAAAAAARGWEPRLVLDAHNAYYLIPRRLAAATRNPALRLFLAREAALLERYEARTYARFHHLLTVTEEDRRFLEPLFPRHGLLPPPMTTVPICVDAAAGEHRFAPEPRGLLLIGGLHWPPNADGARWLLREVWPRVQAQAPDARLFVVGARPPRDILAAGDCTGISRPEDAASAPVAVTGYVEHPSPFIEASAALLVPLRSGGGMRVKIVEAMAWGLPILSTVIGCEGIEAEPGRDLLVADDAAAFADAAVRLLRDPHLRLRLSQAGRELVRQRYDWRDRYRALDAVYDGLGPAARAVPLDTGASLA